MLDQACGKPGHCCLPAFTCDRGQDRCRRRIRIRSRKTTYCQTDLSVFCRGLINEQDTTVDRPELTKSRGDNTLTFLPWPKYLASRSHEARLLDATDHNQRGVVRIEKAIARQHQISTFNFRDGFDSAFGWV